MGWVVGLMVDRDRVFQRRCCPFFSLIFPSLTEMANTEENVTVTKANAKLLIALRNFFIENDLKQDVRSMQVDLEGGSISSQVPNSQQEGRGT